MSDTISISKNKCKVRERSLINNPTSAINYKASGVGENLPEASPVYDKCAYETLVHQDLTNNTWIIAGKDRVHRPVSGYSTDQGAGAIDICVGLAPTNGIGQKAEKSFMADAARIYISRKADIDEYINCKAGDQSMAMSAILVKADDVRIVANNDIKLITGHDSVNSHLKQVKSVGYIDFIAGTEEVLEPVVKGMVLWEYLVQLQDIVLRTNDMLSKYFTIEQEIYRMVQQHAHHSPFAGKKTIQSEEHLFGMPIKNLQIAQQMHMCNSLIMKDSNQLADTYLRDFDKPFLSKRVRTT
tara:strand:+ start:2039 stop:2932 length:894 start_codon:yes stop_codon:yes gene_type:complete